jgi:tRNA dimethylallyltransferase
MIIISGPTGVGKTDISLSIAEQIQGEIINIDVGQFYEPCTIGTAKPDWKNSLTPHHFFDYLDTPQDITVIEYRTEALELMHGIKSRGNIPIFVGGSTFYVASLFFPPQEVSKKIEDSETFDYEISWEELDRIDPERAASIKPTDTYRIARALALYYKTGMLPSHNKPMFDPLDKKSVLILLTRDRADLYERINKRVEEMFAQGWIDEVRALVDTPWQPFLMKKKLIGYDDIFRALAHDAVTGDALEQLKEVIAQKTRHYAKRQETFFRMLKKKISAVNDNGCILYDINLSQAGEAEALLNELIATI